MIKQRIFSIVIWLVVSVISFFAIDKDGAPDWAKEIQILFSLGIFLVMLDTLMEKLWNIVD